jgi:hypothetical protein
MATKIEVPLCFTHIKQIIVFLQTLLKKSLLCESYTSIIQSSTQSKETEYFLLFFSYAVSS